MKLDEALFCVNCEELFSVTDVMGGRCPKCGSEESVALWRWIPSMQPKALQRWLELQGGARGHEDPGNLVPVGESDLSVDQWGATLSSGSAG